jgi:hypothetical protein
VPFDGAEFDRFRIVVFLLWTMSHLSEN